VKQIAPENHNQNPDQTPIKAPISFPQECYHVPQRNAVMRYSIFVNINCPKLQVVKTPSTAPGADVPCTKDKELRKGIA
jgi:hypothetical protein